MGCRLTGLNYTHMAAGGQILLRAGCGIHRRAAGGEKRGDRRPRRDHRRPDRVFRQTEAGLGVRVLADVRTQTTPTRFRVPDVLVIDAAKARHRRYVTGRPLIAIEVLLPDDTRARCISSASATSP